MQHNVFLSSVYLLHVVCVRASVHVCTSSGKNKFWELVFSNVARGDKLLFQGLAARALPSEPVCWPSGALYTFILFYLSLFGCHVTPAAF